MTNNTTSSEQVHLSLPEHEDLDEKSVESLGLGGLLDELRIQDQSISANLESSTEQPQKGRAKSQKG